MSRLSKLTWVLGLLTLIVTITIFSMSFMIKEQTGAFILDLRFWGSRANDVQALFAALRENGAMNLYQKLRTLDLLYPAVYGSFGFLWLLILFGKTKLKWVCALPVISAGFDYAENNLIHKLMNVGPEQYAEIVGRMTVFTQVKYATITLSLVFLGIGLWRYFKGGRHALG